ncbi:hypothetical protein L1987_43210 [Smallanthus sonchifolius]|uniref:Uncharacterized protein n=1 Tax=Smallanthus sonchifolius TaxID=185202 RepID=A0ACB9GL02_9ASTR|nr:hypothetical protein L1987_43210 [Smallanthus sonchifolius]
MMCRTNLPHSFWSFSLETATRIINLAPTKKVDKTPYEIWHGEKPKVSYLRVWGCNAYVTSESTDRLHPHGNKVVFVGYPKTIGYYFYNPAENRVFIKRRATFLEKELLARGIGDNHVDMDEIQEPQPEPAIQHKTAETESRNVQALTVTQAVRRSARDRHEPDRYIGIHHIDDILIVYQVEPTSYKSAIMDSESKKWLEAIDTEIQSMYDNHVWVLADLPPESRTVGSKWNFKKKIDMDGNVQTFKAKLVFKGFTQTQGIDYDETFSAVAMLKSIRILLAIVAYYDYEIMQMDVKTAFLNGHFTKDVSMVQPEGFEDPENPNKVTKERVVRRREAKHNTLSLNILNTHRTVNMDLSEVAKIRHRIMSLTPPPSPKAPTVSSPEPKRRRTSSSDNSVEQGEPSNARARNTTLNWSAYPKMIQRWIEMGNVPSPYFGSTSSSATLPSLPCTMEQAFADFVFIITKELKEMKDSTDEIPGILEREPQVEENKVGIELLTAELAATDQVHNLLVDRVTYLETRVDTSDHDVGGILERVANLEAQLQVADHAAEGPQERVTHLEAQLQVALFPEEIPLLDDEEERF